MNRVLVLVVSNICDPTPVEACADDKFGINTLKSVMNAMNNWMILNRCINPPRRIPLVPIHTVPSVLFTNVDAEREYRAVFLMVVGRATAGYNMLMNITTIAFDADDTLWANEDLFVATQQQYMQLLAPFRADWDAEELHAAERRNLAYFGYGIKGFTLSMIETAIEVSNGAIPGRDIAKIIDMARAMVHAPLPLLPGVAELIPQLSTKYSLMLITKGDLFDQEAKIARSGLADSFRHIEIVSEKSPHAYQRILQRYDINPQSFVMVGNSLRSDILPVIAIGGHAVHIPYHLTWAHEHVDIPANERTWQECASIADFTHWLAQC